MNKDLKALIDQIEVDEHLKHYQKLTHAQRARLLSDMVMASYSIKRSLRAENVLRTREEKKFTPAICRKFLHQMTH